MEFYGGLLNNGSKMKTWDTALRASSQATPAVFIRYKNPYLYDFKLGIRLEIKPSTSIHLNHQNFEMKGKLLFKLLSEKKDSLDQYLKYIKVITCFVNFCAQQPINLLNVKGIVDKEDVNTGNNEIFIYYKSIFFYSDIHKKQPKFLLNFEDLLVSDALFDNWDRLLKKHSHQFSYI